MGATAEVADRLAAARGVLARAEAGAGLRQRLSGATALAPSRVEHGRVEHERVEHERVEQGRVEQGRVEVPPELLLPAPEGLAELLPHGALRRGTAVAVRRSTSLLLALAARACEEGAWCALVGMPDLGLAAAAEAGLHLDRTVVVPRPGPDAPAVLAALIDGFDVVVLGRSRALLERDQRSLTSRLRTREAVLLVGQDWPGAQVVLDVGEPRWVGVGSGEGMLTDREATVTARVRGVGSPRRVRVRLAGGVRAGRVPEPALPATTVQQPTVQQPTVQQPGAAPLLARAG